MARLAVCLVCAAAVLWPVVGCGTIEHSFVFHPRRFPDGDWQLADVPHEDASFQAADGSRLHGWFASVPNPRAVVLYCHGNAGNVTYCDYMLGFYTERLHCSVLVFDYRGYGKSEGTPSPAGILSDARAARHWLAKRAGVAESDIVVVGHSLGGAVAVDLAARDGARALVLESTFTSLREVAESHTAPLRVGWLIDNQLDSLKVIGSYHGPLLQSHGDADRMIPFEEGLRLFEAANEPKTFVKGEGRGHNDVPTREYVEALDSFLERLPPSAGTSER
jgi:fermentation-respiration switch protein FrsA (DUF1100 family)